jgi:hypothetical protein
MMQTQLPPGGLAVAAALLLALGACDREEAAPSPADTAAAPVAANTPPPEQGAPTPDPASCVTYDGAYALAPLMRVRGAADSQVRFQDRAEACPANGECDGRRDGYVIGGDVVLASAPVNGFRCVYAPTTGGDLAAGFLPAAELEAAGDAEPLTPEFLAGRWGHLGETEIAFTRSGAALSVKGQATYETGVPGGVHTGELDGPVTLADGAARYAVDGCEVTARRRGPFLIVSDNNACGGMNVSFGGVYTRAG